MKLATLAKMISNGTELTADVYYDIFRAAVNGHTFAWVPYPDEQYNVQSLISGLQEAGFEVESSDNTDLKVTWR